MWFDRELTRNLLVSLKRVVLGFALAVAVGVPLGVVCGCFRRINAFFGPLVIIGRNIPIAAVIPLTFALFGIGEFQKVMFIFIACVAFIVMDTANSIVEVDSRYVDTAYTLAPAAGRSSSRSSCRFPCLAFSIRCGCCSDWPSATSCWPSRSSSAPRQAAWATSSTSRSGAQQWEDILLVLMIIPLVALAVDRVLVLDPAAVVPLPVWRRRHPAPCPAGRDAGLRGR